MVSEMARDGLAPSTRSAIYPKRSWQTWQDWPGTPIPNREMGLSPPESTRVTVSRSPTIISATPEPMGIALLSTGVLGFLQQDEGRLSDGVGWTTAYGQEIGGCGGGLDVVKLSTLVDG